MRFFLLALLFFLTCFPAMAETGKSPLDMASQREVTVPDTIEKSKYLYPTLENLSTLYWKLGVFDVNDDVAIDNYLRINECSIFTSYFTDDFEWREVREATRKKVEQNRKSFPDKFKFVLPISLGEYDRERGGFEIIDNTGFPQLKRIEFISPYHVSTSACTESKDFQDYETNLLLILEKPLDFTFVKMEEYAAQAFILRKKEEAEAKDEDNKYKRYARTAYVRLRLTIHEYQGTIKGSHIDSMAILYGTLDGLDVFDTKDEKLLITSIDYSKPQSAVNE